MAQDEEIKEGARCPTFVGTALDILVPGLVRISRALNAGGTITAAEGLKHLNDLVHYYHYRPIAIETASDSQDYGDAVAEQRVQDLRFPLPDLLTHATLGDFIGKLASETYPSLAAAGSTVIPPRGIASLARLSCLQHLVHDEWEGLLHEGNSLTDPSTELWEFCAELSDFQAFCIVIELQGICARKGEICLMWPGEGWPDTTPIEGREDLVAVIGRAIERALRAPSLCPSAATAGGANVQVAGLPRQAQYPAFSL